jgi:hypothetical protein
MIKFQQLINPRRSEVSDPALVAAAPALEALIAAIKEAANSTLTGDPATIGLRAGPAFLVLVGKAEQQIPVLANAEQGVVLTSLNARLDALSASLAALK